MKKTLIVIVKISIILGVSELKCESLALTTKRCYVMPVSTLCKFLCKLMK